MKGHIYNPFKPKGEYKNFLHFYHKNGLPLIGVFWGYVITMILIGSSVLAYGAYTQDQFNTTNTEQNITFNSTHLSELVYITIPRNVNITEASWDMTGYLSYYWVYQEEGNASLCSGTWDVTETCEHVNDSDWGTLGYGTPGSAQFYVNYTKPDSNYEVYRWQIKGKTGIVNVSLSSNCKDQSPIQLYVLSHFDGAYKSTWYCHNGTAWEESYEYEEAVTSGKYVYEEAIWWETSDYPTNITIDIANDGVIDYINLSVFNFTETITFNASGIAAINTYLHDTCTADWETGDCDLPINMSSATDGTLEISDISFDGEYLYGRFNLTIYDEMTGDLYNTSNMTLTVLCLNDTEITTITNHTTYEIDVGCEATEFWLEVSDDEGNTHWRTLIPDEGYDDVLEFYMINETEDDAIKQDWIVYDVTGDFTNGSVQVYKVIPDIGRKTIIQQLIDAESKVTLYFIIGEKYELEVVSEDGTFIRNVGGYLADTDTDKRLMVSTIPYSPDQFLTFNDVIIYFDWDKDGAYIRGYYNDSLGETTLVTFTVYNATNITEIMYTTTSTSSIVTFSYTAVDVNGTYIAEIIAEHSRYGTIDPTQVIDFGGLYTITGLAGLGYGIYSSIAAGLISIIALLSFGRRYTHIGTVVFVFFIMLFMHWGWFGDSPVMTWSVITLAAFMAFANMMGRKERSP